MSLTRTTSSRCGTFLESSHYKPCGPVIVIAGGEVTAEYHEPLLTNSRRPGTAASRIPWSAATPHRIGENAGRQSTTEQPFILIDPATHHWDEDDVPGEPVQAGVPRRSKIVDMHDQQVAFVKAWFNEFHDSKGGSA
ncbi:hypothetical protein NHJ6243_008161 [Beauveria neobassiana]